MADSADIGSDERVADGARAPWLARALLESLLIVLSVLLALGLDEWRDQRTRDARARMALASIDAELRDNAETVERARTHHLGMRDSLRLYVDRQQQPPPHVYLFGLFNPALVHATAWDSARETGATGEMPFELLLTLSGVYDMQARYRSLGDALAQDIMRQIRREGLEVVLRDGSERFITLQEDFAGRESTLLEAYAAALEDLRRGPAAFRSAGAPGGG